NDRRFSATVRPKHRREALVRRHTRRFPRKLRRFRVVNALSRKPRQRRRFPPRLLDLGQALQQAMNHLPAPKPPLPIAARRKQCRVDARDPRRRRDLHTLAAGRWRMRPSWQRGFNTRRRRLRISEQWLAIAQAFAERRLTRLSAKF